MSVWTFVRFAHVLGVAVWLGGMLFLGLVAVPAVRAVADGQTGRALITSVGRRFGVVGGAAWVVILTSGTGLMHHRGLAFGNLTRTDAGRTILTKLVLLALVGVAVVVHAAWQGPRVRRAEAAGDGPTARRWMVVGAVLDTFMLLATLVALWLATTLIG